MLVILVVCNHFKREWRLGSAPPSRTLSVGSTGVSHGGKVRFGEGAKTSTRGACAPQSRKHPSPLAHVSSDTGHYLVALAHRFGKSNVAGLQIELSFCRSAEDARAFIVEVSFPARDYYRGQAIPHQVHGRTAHVH